MSKLDSAAAGNVRDVPVRLVAWRNSHTTDSRLRKVTARANVA